MELVGDVHPHYHDFITGETVPQSVTPAENPSQNAVVSSGLFIRHNFRIARDSSTDHGLVPTSRLWARVGRLNGIA